MLLCDKLTVVLHQVRSPDNLGAVARAMANFGFQGLSLSEPITRAFDEAQKMAVKSAHVLARLQVCRTLPEALGPCVWVCGTTSRQSVQRRVVSSPEEAVRRLSRKAEEGQVALVFGGERHGLTDEDLAHCQDILATPFWSDFGAICGRLWSPPGSSTRKAPSAC
jgi:tRNA/rRNA methyltransferase